MDHISISAAGTGPLHSKWPRQIHSFFMMRRWKDQHCRRQTLPLPRCLFQPCFKIHDSSFQSVMNGRWCQSCDVFSDRSLVSEDLHKDGFMALGLSTSTFLFDIRDRYHGVVLTMEVPQIQEMDIPVWQQRQVPWRFSPVEDTPVWQQRQFTPRICSEPPVNISTRMCWSRQRCRQCQLR